MVRRSLFYFFDSLLLGLCQMVLVKKKSEEIDDETLSPEVSSSISPRPPPLLPAARKGLRLGFGEQNLHTGRRRKSPYRRRAGRRLCSPPPAKAYCFVSGSKKFTQGGGGKRFNAGSPAAAFAPRKGLWLRFGEQKVHTRRRRKTLYHRLAGRGLCSPLPGKAYGSVSGRKKFTQGGGENRFIAGSPAAAFAPRRPQRLTASYRGAKSSHKAAAENALLPSRIPFLRRR